MASIKYEKIRIMYVIVHNVHALFARILPNDINTKQSWSLHSRAASIQPATVETQSPSHHRRPGTARLKNAFNQIFTTIYFDSLIQIFRSTRPATEYLSTQNHKFCHNQTLLQGDHNKQGNNIPLSLCQVICLDIQPLSQSIHNTRDCGTTIPASLPTHTVSRYNLHLGSNDG
uniref:Uncharacterized protein n=1 Tax=Cacopsylla melanoneura TaxID=428564 RepID=A0A8D9BZ57_9HEMI